MTITVITSILHSEDTCKSPQVFYGGLKTQQLGFMSENFTPEICVRHKPTIQNLF